MIQLPRLVPHEYRRDRGNFESGLKSVQLHPAIVKEDEKREKRSLRDLAIYDREKIEEINLVAERKVI